MNYQIVLLVNIKLKNITTYIKKTRLKHTTYIIHNKMRVRPHTLTHIGYKI